MQLRHDTCLLLCMAVQCVFFLIQLQYYVFVVASLPEFYIEALNPYNPASHKRDIGKQCGPGSDAAERGV